MDGKIGDPFSALIVLPSADVPLFRGEIGV
jgi:hypothetical protein